jgi:hypothetical protein
MDYLEIIAYIIMIILIGIGLVGGIGPGIVKVPLLMLFLNYSQEKATAIAYPLTLGINNN